MLKNNLVWLLLFIDAGRRLARNAIWDKALSNQSIHVVRP